MAKKAHPCIAIIRAAVGDKISKEQADGIINEILEQVKNGDLAALGNVEARITKIGKDIVNDNKMHGALQKRQALLTIKAERTLNDFVARFDNMGEGFAAYINGTKKIDIQGGRNSIHAQSVALRSKYVGQLVAGLEQKNLTSAFRNGRLDQEIFQELWNINSADRTSVSGSKEAFDIANIINEIHREMIPRENRAGAFIRMIDNYVMTQTHDRHRIRKAGGLGYGPGSKEASFKAWSEMVLPLLDEEKTFVNLPKSGKARAQFLHNVHEGILTGVHGKSQARAQAEFTSAGALAKKVSQPRILHFKDAESAFTYNQMFGVKSLRDGIVGDLIRSARDTAMMENLGPNPSNTFERNLRAMRERARGLPDDAKQMKTLDSEFLQGSFDNMIGKLSDPANPTLHAVTRGFLAHSSLTKLGQVTLSAIPDKAFFHSAGTYQGMKGMDLFIEQFKVFAPKTTADRNRIHLMGAAIDGWLGDVSSRFTTNDNKAGRMYKLQQGLFKINGMNWWNDIHKGSFAKLEAAHLGTHANMVFDALPNDLSRVLNSYDLTPDKWDLIRTTAYTAEDGRIYITPDQLKNIPDTSIDRAMAQSGEKVTSTNRKRYRDNLETNLRSFIVDQVDDAVVTPGNREQVISNLNTRAGTVKGSAARLLMHFKSFPISVFERIVKRELFGHGRFQGAERIFNKGNFRMLQLIAMTTVGGYVSMAVKDALKGRTPRKLTHEDGSMHFANIAQAMQRGGGLGIYGDLMLNEYDRSYRNALNIVAGPVIGQIPEALALGTDLREGKNISRSAEKLGLNNTPYINLFYIRPVLDYIILWNIQEMMNPGSLRRMEQSVENRNNQGFFIRPSEVVNR